MNIECITLGVGIIHRQKRGTSISHTIMITDREEGKISKDSIFLKITLISQKKVLNEGTTAKQSYGTATEEGF